MSLFAHITVCTYITYMMIDFEKQKYTNTVTGVIIVKDQRRKKSKIYILCRVTAYFIW